MVGHELSNISYFSFSGLDACEKVVSFVTTRGAVVAGDPYSSFNLGEWSGDDPARVAENRACLCRELQIPEENLLTAHQVHGTEVAVIESGFLSSGREARAEILDGVDALITDVPDIALTVSTADCVPVLLFDEEHRAAAAIHAGWRGMSAHIIPKTIARMAECYGTLPSRLSAAVGPSIGFDAFEVGDEVVEAFAAAGFTVSRIAARHKVSGKYHIDLWAAATDELIGSGIGLDRIEVAGICTRTHADRFFSARASGVSSGRFLTGICMR